MEEKNKKLSEEIFAQLKNLMGGSEINPEKIKELFDNLTNISSASLEPLITQQNYFLCELMPFKDYKRICDLIRKVEISFKGSIHAAIIKDNKMLIHSMKSFNGTVEDLVKNLTIILGNIEKEHKENESKKHTH